MPNKDINCFKVVLADKKRTNKWLAEQLGIDPATISKWYTNNAQPNMEKMGVYSDDEEYEDDYYEHDNRKSYGWSIEELEDSY